MKILLLLMVLGSMFYGNTTLIASKEAITLWYTNILPSFLFPLIMIRSISSYHLFYYLFYPLKKIIRFLFHMDLYTFEILFTSLLLGFPSNTLFIEENLIVNISNKAYEKCMYIPFMSSFNFILISLSSLYSLHVLFILLLTQILTIFVLLFLHKENISLCTPKEKTIFKIQFSNAIHKTFHILLLILAYLVITYVSLAILSKFIPSKILLPFSILAEFASGCFKINTLNISLFYKVFFTNLLLSYGGLCVHLQLISNLSNKFNYLKFLKYRLQHMFIASIILILLLKVY